MTRFIHNQFAKDYLEELLKPYGEVQGFSRVAGEVREIDVLFSPLTKFRRRRSGVNYAIKTTLSTRSGTSYTRRE